MNETFVATYTTNVAIPTCRPAFATSLAHLDKRVYSHLYRYRLPLLPSIRHTHVNE